MNEGNSSCMILVICVLVLGGWFMYRSNYGDDGESAKSVKPAAVSAPDKNDAVKQGGAISGRRRNPATRKKTAKTNSNVVKVTNATVGRYGRPVSILINIIPSSAETRGLSKRFEKEALSVQYHLRSANTAKSEYELYEAEAKYANVKWDVRGLNSAKARMRKAASDRSNSLRKLASCVDRLAGLKSSLEAKATQSYPLDGGSREFNVKKGGCIVFCYGSYSGDVTFWLETVSDKDRADLHMSNDNSTITVK